MLFEVSCYPDAANNDCNDPIDRLTQWHGKIKQHTDPGDTLYQNQDVKNVTHGATSFRVDLQPIRTVSLQPYGLYFYTPGRVYTSTARRANKRGNATLTKNTSLKNLYIKRHSSKPLKGFKLYLIT